MAGCATPGTQVMPAYELHNGAVFQDVVMVATDRRGTAPVITTLTTYDVSEDRNAVVVSREFAQGAGGMTSLMQGFGLAMPVAAGAAIAAALDDGNETVISNTSYARNRRRHGSVRQAAGLCGPENHPRLRGVCRPVHI